MSAPMRPATLGEILDRTVNIYRSRFWVFLGIATAPAAVVLVCVGAVVALGAWLGQLGPEGALVAGLVVIGVAMVGLPLYLVAMALSAAAVAHAASDEYMGGKATIRGAYRTAWKRGWRNIGIMVMQALAVSVPPMVVWVILIGLFTVNAVLVRGAGGAATPVGATLLMLLGLAVYMVWMVLRLCLAFPVAAVEGRGVWEALKRAWRLSEGTRWRMLLMFVLLVVLGWMLSGLITAPVTIAVMLIPGMTGPQHAQTAGTVLLIAWYTTSFAVQALTRPVYGIGLVMFYYDQRVRKEAFDIELLMRAAGMAPAAEAQPEAAPWMPPIAGPSGLAGAENNAEAGGAEEPRQAAGGPA